MLNMAGQGVTPKATSASLGAKPAFARDPFAFCGSDDEDDLFGVPGGISTRASTTPTKGSVAGTTRSASASVVSLSSYKKTAGDATPLTSSSLSSPTRLRTQPRSRLPPVQLPVKTHASTATPSAAYHKGRAPSATTGVFEATVATTPPRTQSKRSRAASKPTSKVAPPPSNDEELEADNAVVGRSSRAQTKKMKRRNALSESEEEEEEKEETVYRRSGRKPRQLMAPEKKRKEETKKGEEKEPRTTRSRAVLKPAKQTAKTAKATTVATKPVSTFPSTPVTTFPTPALKRRVEDEGELVPVEMLDETSVQHVTLDIATFDPYKTWLVARSARAKRFIRHEQETLLLFRPATSVGDDGSLSAMLYTDDEKKSIFSESEQYMISRKDLQARGKHKNSSLLTRQAHEEEEAKGRDDAKKSTANGVKGVPLSKGMSAELAMTRQAVERLSAAPLLLSSSLKQMRRDQQEHGNEEEEAPVRKRGRGRPAATTASVQKTVKKARGRPKKKQTTANEADDAGDEEEEDEEEEEEERLCASEMFSLQTQRRRKVGGAQRNKLKDAEEEKNTKKKVGTRKRKRTNDAEGEESDENDVDGALEGVRLPSETDGDSSDSDVEMARKRRAEVRRAQEEQEKRKKKKVKAKVVQLKHKQQRQVEGRRLTRAMRQRGEEEKQKEEGEEEEEEEEEGEGEENEGEKERKRRREEDSDADDDEDSDGAMNPDSYFTAQQSEGATSGRTFSGMKVRLMDSTEVEETLKRARDSTYTEARTQLLSLHASKYTRWQWELMQHFNLLFYGYGSKRDLLNHFLDECVCPRFPVVIVNGFFPNVTIKQVLSSISSDILKKPCQFASLDDHCEFIREALKTSSVDRIVVAVHNLDGAMLRHDRAQNALASLAAMPQIQFIASIDHINAPLLWNQRRASEFNWLWHDVTTFVPYQLEISYENSILSKSKRMGTAGALYVLRSVTDNAREVFELIANRQLLLSERKVENSAISFPELFKQCQDRFFGASEPAWLRRHLGEFHDHDLLRSRKGADGIEMIWCPFDKDSLLTLQETMEMQR